MQTSSKVSGDFTDDVSWSLEGLGGQASLDLSEGSAELGLYAAKASLNLGDDAGIEVYAGWHWEVNLREMRAGLGFFTIDLPDSLCLWCN